MSDGLKRSKDLMAQHRRSMVDWVKAELSGANLK